MTDEAKNGQAEAETQGKPKAERKAYKLKAPHRHRGVLHPAGASVDLTAEQAARLRKGKNPKV